MAARRTFALPDLGEGLTDGEVLAWLVQVGDVVTVNQPLVEVETAKAAVELPSPWAGRVAELHVRAGETLDVGAPLVSLDVEETDRAPADPAPASTRAPAATPAPEREPVLVGYGPRPTSVRRRPRRRPAGAPASTAHPAPTARPAQPPAPTEPVAPLASPPVRRRARQLGVDLAAVPGSGPRGLVTSADLEAAAAGRAAPVPPRVPPAEEGARRVPAGPVRRATAAAMVASAFTAPHATVFLTVDATGAVETAARLGRQPELEGLPVGPLLLAAKAVLVAARRHPQVNARWDAERQEVVLFDAVNLGIAAATPRGLLVPNVKDAGRLPLPDLARAIADLTAAARAGTTSPADLRGGTLTITNVGVFGVDGGTPILNPGEAVILCLGAVRPRPWVHQGELAVRQVVELSLSFDHRLVDGELASCFLRDVGALLEDPALALAWC